MVTITIDRITKEFPGTRGAAPVRAVDDVSIKIPSGELFFLLGPSGCGKTTLLRTIAGFSPPTSGRIFFDAQEITPVPPHKRDTGMVFQSYALWPHMTVSQNVAFGLDARGIGEPERGRRIREALTLVQMETLGDRRPNQLSGGQQQRVALARAISIRPKCLLLDEPLSNLDARLRLEMRAEIRRIVKASGITGIYVTHDQKEALAMADQIAVMHAGRLEQVGTPQELYRHPATVFVAGFIGESNTLSGKVESVNGETVRIATAAGVLVARRAGGLALTPGKVVTVVFRPEAASLHASAGPAGNHLRVKRLGTTYLGEMAEHTLALAGAGGDAGPALKVFELNPGVAVEGGEAFLRIPAEQVIVLG